MEFLGYTIYGPQNYIKDIMKEEYREPMSKEDARPMIQKIQEYSTLPTKIERPSINIIRVIDCFTGRVNGFAYGSKQRFIKMKRKGVIKPVGPCDMYRFPPTSSIEYGWWQHDSVIANSTWHYTYPKHPQSASPNTLILDKVQKNNKYASLF